MASYFSESDNIRESYLDTGISGLKSRIKDMDLKADRVIPEQRVAEKKYTQEDIADLSIGLYRNINPKAEGETKEVEVANTVASRANARALAKSLANIRNGGYAGPTTEFTPSANGDVNPGRRCGYNALVVAGTEMTLEQSIEAYKEEVETRMEACWKGYKKKGMKTMFGKQYPNCVKEDEEQIDEVTYPSDFVKGSGVAKKKYGRPVQHDQPVRGLTSPVRKTIDETSVVDELKDNLVEMDDHSWQSIDKVMRSLAKENDITPKELHKMFKAESNGMIPDDWAKKHAIKEECGYMPLDEAVAVNKLGNVFDVTLMWKAHTRRLKFFWPELGYPSNDDMQRAVEMFYPGGKLVTYYQSTEAGDNQTNYMVMVPAIRESVFIPQDAWEEMTDEECGIYEYILAEEGEPTSPPMMHEDGSIEVWVEDHETGEEKKIFFSEKEGKKDACYHKVKSRYKVWPSAYASGALVKCRKKGAGSWGNSDKKEEYMPEDMSGMSQKSGDKRSTESGAGMTAQGVAKYNRRTGGNLKTAVTTPPSKLKPGSKAAGRRKSFCARSRGWDGERGKAARRRWNC